MLLDFNGKEILDLKDRKISKSMAEYVGEMIVDPKQTSKYSAIRTYEIARKIVLEGKYDAIGSDYTMIYDLIEKSDMWGALIRGQILLLMNEIKENYEKELQDRKTAKESTEVKDA